MANQPTTLQGLARRLVSREQPPPARTVAEWTSAIGELERQSADLWDRRRALEQERDTADPTAPGIVERIASASGEITAISRVRDQLAAQIDAAREQLEVARKKENAARLPAAYARRHELRIQFRDKLAEIDDIGAEIDRIDAFLAGNDGHASGVGTHDIRAQIRRWWQTMRASEPNYFK